MFKSGLFLFALLFVSGCATHSFDRKTAPGLRDWGPFYSQHKDVDGNLRTRALGPVVERVTSPRGDSLTAVRPFYSKAVDASEERIRQEVLWPLASSKQWLGEHRWWAGPVWGWNYDVDDPQSQKRLWVVPFWFSGISREGENYAALWPVWGTVNDFLTLDEIKWQLWPLHVTTRNETGRGVTESEAWMWPFVSKTEGPKSKRFRIFPAYGTSSFEGKYEKRFIAWPFWTDATYKYPEDTGRAWMLFPIYGQLDSATQKTRWYLPPLFRVESDGDGQRTFLPWPFVQYEEGDELSKRYLFPFWGTKTVGNTKSDFALYPVFWHQQIQRGGELVDRKLALPVIQHETRTQEDGTITTRKEKIWPFGSYRREHTVARTRLLDLWPMLDTAAIERNYAPLWSLYRKDQRLDRGASDTEIFWGIYRHLDHAGEGRHQSVFPFWERWSGEDGSGWQVGKGLLGGGDEGLKVLWLSVGKVSSE